MDLYFREIYSLYVSPFRSSNEHNTSALQLGLTNKRTFVVLGSS